MRIEHLDVRLSAPDAQRRIGNKNKSEKKGLRA
jgi:hypothetical protein